MCIYLYVCLFLPLVRFLPKCLSVSLSLSHLSLCLAATLLWSLYSLSVFTVIVSFDFVTQQLFSSTISIIFCFIFSSINWGRIQDIEFEQHGLLLPIRCMGKLFKVSTNYFALFVLQRVTFYFCLFLKLSLATTISVDTCLCLSFDII